MDAVQIRKQIEIAASPAEVWHYVGTAAGLGTWWQATITMEPTVGGAYQESGTVEGQPYRRHGKVLTYDPPRQLRIALTEEYPAAHWPTDAEIDITIDGDANRSTVTVVHRAVVEARVAVCANQAATALPAPALAGPTMMLPGQARTFSTVETVRFTTDNSVPTLATLYRWRARQEAYWQQWCSQLSLIISQ